MSRPNTRQCSSSLYLVSTGELLTPHAFVYVLLISKKGEGEREKCFSFIHGKESWIVAFCTPPTRDQAHILGVCPDRESNCHLLAHRSPTEPRRRAWPHILSVDCLLMTSAPSALSLCVIAALAMAQGLPTAASVLTWPSFSPDRATCSLCLLSASGSPSSQLPLQRLCARPGNMLQSL